MKIFLWRENCDQVVLTSVDVLVLISLSSLVRESVVVQLVFFCRRHILHIYPITLPGPFVHPSLFYQPNPTQTIIQNFRQHFASGSLKSLEGQIRCRLNRPFLGLFLTDK